VYFHHFFPEGDKVSDAQLRPLLEQTLDQEHPREFYWALMDYGSWLKRQGVGKINQSHHYKKQSALVGSVREVRGQIIRELTAGDMTYEQLQRVVIVDGRFERALAGVVHDGLVSRRGDLLHLTK
jgi:A/G-specific adenine glycosylase